MPTCLPACRQNAPPPSGELLRRHVTSKKALVITNDKVGPLYLDKTVAVRATKHAISITTPTLFEAQTTWNRAVGYLFRYFHKYKG